MRKSYTNLRIAHNDDIEEHNWRHQQSQSLMKENLKLYNRNMINILNIYNKNLDFNKAGDIKDEFKNYKILKNKIRKEHTETVKKEQKTGIKIKSFSDGVLTFSTDIYFKFIKDENFIINFKNEKLNLKDANEKYNQIEKEITSIKIELNKYMNMKNKDHAIKDKIIILNENLHKKEIDFKIILNQIKSNFDVKNFNETGIKTFKKMEEELGMNILYSVLHLDEKTPHFHFEFENFKRDKDGKITNKGKAIFTKTNHKNNSQEVINDRFNIKNAGAELQDIANYFFNDFNISRGEKRERRSKIDINNLYIKATKWHKKEEFFNIKRIKNLEIIKQEKEKEFTELQSKNDELFYNNFNIELQREKELQEFTELQNQRKDEIIKSINLEITAAQNNANNKINNIKKSQEQEIINLINELNIIKDNSREIIEIMKDLRAFTTTQKIDVDTKKIIYSLITNNQTELREIEKDARKQIKELKDVKEFNTIYKDRIKEIIEKANTWTGINKETLLIEILKEIKKITGVELQFKRIQEQENTITNLKNTNKEQENTITNLKNTNKEQENTITNLENNIINLENNITNLENNITNLENTIKETILKNIQEIQEIKNIQAVKDLQIKTAQNFIEIEFKDELKTDPRIIKLHNLLNDNKTDPNGNSFFKELKRLQELKESQELQELQELENQRKDEIIKTVKNNNFKRY